ncbi:unnamed protein product [Adineta ricciae]|uniref:Uncharacterized protein n=1 Tax=Adineta ricciae TaxID=249248 RepID=A0A813UUV0_ADIRI|nr:unnamed protein product [Adineta ricciae]
MDTAGVVRRVVNKPRDIIPRNPAINPDTLLDVPEFNFTYNDADTIHAEISELYTYSEEPEFVWNAEAFNVLFQAKYGGAKKWKEYSRDEKIDFIIYLLEQCELVDRNRRLQAMRAMLYLIQGVFYQCSDVDEYMVNAKENVLLFYTCDGVHIFIDLFNMELNFLCNENNQRTTSKNLSDNQDMRVIISILYTVIEFARQINDDTDEQWTNFQKRLYQELSHPNDNDELFANTLYHAICVFCNAPSPPLPIRKLLLILWKVLLYTLGTLDDAFEKKNKARREHGLEPINENPAIVIAKMPPVLPPLAGAECLEMQGPTEGGSSARRAKRQSFTKQSALDTEAANEEGSNNGNTSATSSSTDDDTSTLVSSSSGPSLTPSESTTSLASEASSIDPATTLMMKELPWVPKVRQKDLEAFLEHTRKKFVGFCMKDDLTTLIGLPKPIHESIKILKQHLYVPLSEVQIKIEDEIAKYPLSKKEVNIPDTAAERLYRATLTQIPQFLIALLKLLLTSTPTAKPKTESINILCDVIPEEMPCSMVQSMKLGSDINRHKEMIVKAVSAILLLLLKHLKVNHIYQFEYICQNLVFSNCITVILKFFNHNILSHIQAKNTIPPLDFPTCVIGPQPELTADLFDAPETDNYCWRNMFSSINLLRILNKLTKGKHARTMVLVAVKSAPILRKTLRVKQAMMQLYALKLLKLQTRYLGRQWRKSNMMAISAIYQRVRHRLNDDWAYGNEQETQTWDFQTEERALRNKIDIFNQRRYHRLSSPNANNNNTNNPANASTQNASANEFDFDSFTPVNNDLLTALSSNQALGDQDLPEAFKRHYEEWLNDEVFNAEQQTDWDALLQPKSIVIY